MRDRTASLQRLSDHHEGILDSVGEGVVSVDATDEVTFANPTAAVMLGAASDSLLGADSRTLVCPVPPEPGHRCVHDSPARRGP